MSDDNKVIVFDNERDRFVHGFDAGQIVEGTVTQVEDSFIIVDDDGVGYDVTKTLRALLDQKIRLTVITLEAIDGLEKMLLHGVTK